MFRRAYRFLYDSPELLKCNINNLDVSFRGNHIVFDYSNVIFVIIECFNSLFLFFSLSLLLTFPSQDDAKLTSKGVHEPKFSTNCQVSFAVHP